MVHQSSSCYKDLTPRHFVVSSTSVRCARVINWKSVSIVLCCCVQYVEIYTEQRAFADSINFFFSLEENCCRIMTITSRSLWWTCFIARYVRTVVSTFQKWWLRGCRQGTCKSAKNSKLWNCKHCRTKMIRKHKNNSPINWALVNKLIPIGYKRWERLKTPINRYHMSWTTGQWKSARTHITFCLLDTNRSRFCTV